MRVFKANKIGFTLVEMMVVMTIIALLSVLGLGALFQARNGEIVEESAQNILSAIREIQNKAVAVEAVSGKVPVVWTLELYSNSYEIISVDKDLNRSGTSTTTILPTVTFTLKKPLPLVDTSVTTSSISFSAPFGKPYICDGQCYWEPSSRPENDFEIKTANVPIEKYISFTNNSDWKLQIHLDYKNNTRDIYVESDGDSYVK